MATDPSDFCSNPNCGGTADACGCPADHNTQDLMRCPHCDGMWYRPHGSTSTTCLHPKCGRDGSTVARPARYAPTRDENGQPLERAEPDDGECHAEFIDGSWTSCGCLECEARDALEDGEPW